MLTQVELEHEMYAFGRHRTENMMQRNEEGGRADNNPYAKAIYRRFVMPLAEIIREDLVVKRAGKRKAHAQLLAPMDPEAVAYLAVRNVLNSLMNGDKPGNQQQAGPVPATARQVTTAVGRAVYHEHLLSLFETADPALFYTLVNDLGRRMSKSERHRMTVFKMQAKENGIPFPEWGAGGSTQVGAYLVNELENLGMLETKQAQVAAGRKAQVRQTIDVRLSEEMLEIISKIKGHIIETTPYYLPCVEAPVDYSGVAVGRSARLGGGDEYKG